MLTISKPLFSGAGTNLAQERIHFQQQSYWSGGYAVHGDWQGRLVRKYGLAGAVTEEKFARLSQGRSRMPSLLPLTILGLQWADHSREGRARVDSAD